jgi:hypothetical protein
MRRARHPGPAFRPLLGEETGLSGLQLVERAIVPSPNAPYGESVITDSQQKPRTHGFIAGADHEN